MIKPVTAITEDDDNDDYEDAAKRHLRDARHLMEHGSIDNAGHLVEFAAECAIKFRIDTIRGNGSSPSLHLPQILSAARKHLGERVGYTSMYSILKEDVFHDWSVHHRYSPTGKATSAQFTRWIGITQRLFAAAGIKVRLP